MIEWFHAFVLTQLVEIPIYYRASRNLKPQQRLAYAIGASAWTHPIVWFVFPWESAPYVPTLLAAEAFAIGGESLWGKAFGVSHPLRWSLIANASSVAVGMITRALFAWP
jgi:hypothetical protein